METLLSCLARTALTILEDGKNLLLNYKTDIMHSYANRVDQKKGEGAVPLTGQRTHLYQVYYVKDLYISMTHCF